MLPNVQKERLEHAGDDNLIAILSWKAPGRPFRKKSREFFLSALLLVIFIEVILFLFSQYLLMVVVISLLFLSFVLVVVPPEQYAYVISSQGIMIKDHFYIWSELYDFYFKKIDKVDVLIVRTKLFMPPELSISLGEMEKAEVRSILVNFLPYREVVPPTFLEKTSGWLEKNFPLERESSKK